MIERATMYTYKYYKNLRKENKEKYPEIDYKTFHQVCKAFNLKVVDKILEGKTVGLPGRMGSMYIRAFEIDFNKPPVNIYETVKAKREDPNADEVYFLNFHSDNRQAKVIWAKPKYLRNKMFYKFHPSRGVNGVKTKLAEVMFQKDGYKRFRS